MFKSAGYTIILASLFLQTALAAVSVKIEEKMTRGNFPIGTGSSVVLKSDDNKLAGPALFLGNIIEPNGDAHFQMYLNKNSKKIYFVHSRNFSRENSEQQKILDPSEQAGGTCTGYAINNFLHQTNLSGFTGTGELEKQLSTEEGRTWQMVDAVNQYYLVLQHRFSIKGIMNGYGKKYGFGCKVLRTDNYEKVKKDMLTHLDEGLPVMISFPIGPKMVTSPFQLFKYDEPKSVVDDRLWVPRKTGERNAGGHTIIAASYFEFENKTYLVMIDSDWNEPRVWDMESFLNNKTALDEVEFISCKEKDL